MKPIANAILCYERWDYEAFNRLRELNIQPKEVKNDIRQIQLEQNEEGRVMVRYWTKKGDSQGRIYGNLVSYDEKYPNMYLRAGHSLQGLAGWVRRYISHKHYRDFDICNCAPNLMAQVLARYNLCPTSLTQFNANRSAILEKYTTRYNIPRSEVKEVFLAILHTGKGDPRFRESMILKAQLDTALKELAKRGEYITLYKQCLRRGNQQGSFAFCVWSREEHKVLMCMRDYFVSLGYHAERMVFIYDGLMVEKNDELDRQGVVSLEALSNHIREVTGYVLQVEEKSLVPTEADLALVSSFS